MLPVVGDDKRDRDTPPTGTAIPRPRVRELGKSSLDETRSVYVFDYTKTASSPPQADVDVDAPPPSNPTIADVYKLIDKRLSPLIVQRISSIPAPPARQSLPVRVAKRSPKWLAYALAGLTIIGQGIAAASREEYRGPIVQAVKLISFGVSEFFSDDPAAPPLTTPE